MASIGRLEKQLAALKDKQAEVRKELETAKRQERAKEKAAQRRAEQAEALAFLKVCKTMKISDKQDAKTVYEWVRNKMKSEAKPETKTEVKPEA